jgi:hypothetical protein
MWECLRDGFEIFGVSFEERTNDISGEDLRAKDRGKADF